jgi:hypothetical protein
MIDEGADAGFPFADYATLLRHPDAPLDRL